MPTVIVLKKELQRQLGKTLTDKEFEELCFQFGLELAAVTSIQNLINNGEIDPPEAHPPKK